jgi:hypothetical protein
MSSRKVLADRMILEAMHPAFALLEVDGVVREVPMDDGM